MRLRLLGLLLIVCFAASGAWAQDATPEVTLSETFIPENIGFSVQYPAGWQTKEESSQLLLASSESILNHGFDDTFASGDIQIILASVPMNDFIRDTDFTADTRVIDVLADAIAQENTDEDFKFEKPQVTPVNDWQGASVRLSSAKFDAYLLVYKVNRDLVIASITLTAPGELDPWIKIAKEIAASLKLASASATPTVEPPQLGTLSASFTLKDGSLSVQYPSNWSVREGSPHGIDLANSPDALDLWFHDKFEAGDVHIYLGSGSARDLFKTSTDETSTVLELMQIGIKAESADGITYSPPEEITLNDHPAAFTRATQANSETYLAVIDYGEGVYVAVQMQTAVGELEQWQPTLLAILDSLEVASA